MDGSNRPQILGWGGCLVTGTTWGAGDEVALQGSKVGVLMCKGKSTALPLRWLAAGWTRDRDRESGAAGGSTTHPSEAGTPS
eukprot:768520-Hanusia_phi.AAC.9